MVSHELTSLEPQRALNFIIVGEPRKLTEAWRILFNPYAVTFEQLRYLFVQLSLVFPKIVSNILCMTLWLEMFFELDPAVEKFFGTQFAVKFSFKCIFSLDCTDFGEGHTCIKFLFRWSIAEFTELFDVLGLWEAVLNSFQHV